MLLWGGVFLQTGALGASVPDARFSSPTWHVEQRVISDHLRFTDVWRLALFQSALAESRSGALIPTTTRGAMLHCHRVFVRPPSAVPPPPPPPQRQPMPRAPGSIALGEDAANLNAGMRSAQLASAFHTHRVCPYWNTSDPTPPRDERAEFDAAIGATWRPTVRAERDSLLARWDVAAREAPTSRLVSGQRLRLALDQGDVAYATRVVDECGADAWWCAALRGHLRERLGDVAGALAAFDAMPIQSPERCAIFDVGALLPDSTPEAAAVRPCMTSPGLLDTLWWLSRPFLEDTSRVRAAVHYSRQVDALLHRQLSRTERYWMLDSAGGDAIANMLRRYGRPQLMTTLGRGRVADLHSEYLIDRGLTGPLTEPYPTFEYTRGQIALVPRASALRDPFSALPTDWQVSPPRDEFDQEDATWFPYELWMPPTPLIQLQRGQAVQFRREGAVHHAAALPLISTGTRRAIGATIPRVRLVRSTGPTHVHRVSTFAARVGGPLVVRADLPPVPAIIGVEYDATGAAPGGRARWGFRPIETLDDLPPGTYAVSAPAIVAPARGIEILTGDPDATIPRLLPQLTFAPSEDIGVYWETYGLQPSDTVDLAIWVQRTNAQGTLRTLGVTLRVATDLNTPIGVTWQEPQPERAAVRFGGAVPIMGRAITLSLASLIDGEYVLEVVVAKPGQTPVRGRTQFAVRR